MRASACAAGSWTHCWRARPPLSISWSISVGPPGTSHNVYAHVPGDHPWTWGGYVLFRDHEAFTLKLVHPNVIQVHVRFDDSGRTPWRIDVDEFFRATV